MLSLPVPAAGEDELRVREGSRKIRDTSGTQGDAGRAPVLSQMQTQHKDVKTPISGSKKHRVGQGGLFGP